MQPSSMEYQGVTPIASFVFEPEEEGLAIKKYVGSDKVVVVPATAQGLPVVRVGEKAFAECGSLKEVVLPEGIRTIGSEAFYGCKALCKITLPHSLNQIGEIAFEGTELFCNPANRKDGVLYHSGCLLDVNEDYIGTLTVPQGIFLLADACARNCYFISAVELPHTLKKIGNLAFA